MDAMPKKYSPEFRADVARVARRGDRPVAEVAADFDVSLESVRRWKRQTERDDGMKDGLTTAEQSVLRPAAPPGPPPRAGERDPAARDRVLREGRRPKMNPRWSVILLPRGSPWW